MPILPPSHVGAVKTNQLPAGIVLQILHQEAVFLILHARLAVGFVLLTNLVDFRVGSVDLVDVGVVESDQHDSLGDFGGEKRLVCAAIDQAAFIDSLRGSQLPVVLGPLPDFHYETVQMPSELGPFDAGRFEGKRLGIHYKCVVVGPCF